jgi:hypothetical protein
VTVPINGESFGLPNWNEIVPNHVLRNHWRASLVPAAAVIPAPTAYIMVVAVKTFVVEHQRRADHRSTRFGGTGRRQLSYILVVRTLGATPRGAAGSYLEQRRTLEVGKERQNRLAWNNRLTATSSVGWHFAVMVNRGARGQPYCRGRGEIR